MGVFSNTFGTQQGSQQNQSYSYYVSNSGNDLNDGLTPYTALATIDKVNTLDLSEEITTVLFKSGDSFEGTITISNSGNESKRIIFSKYGTGDKPKIYGSQLITGWNLYSGNIYQATFTSTINQLFVNDVRMQEARYPETGYINVDAAPTTSSLTSSSLNGTLNYSGVKCLIHSSSYGLETTTVVSSTGTTLTLNRVPFGNVNINEKFMLVGKLDFLTKPGQWFYDSTTTTVYLWTPNSDNPEGYDIRGSILDYGIVGTNKLYIQINDLNILQQKTNGILLTGCDYVDIKENDVNNQDAIGIRSISSGDNLIITKNNINGANHLGIECYTSNSNLTGNTVSNIGLPDALGGSGIGSWYMGSGIYTEGSNNFIHNNTVNETGYNGIHFAGGIHTVSKNYVTNCGRVKNDGGHIYTSASVNYGNESNKGSLITQNIVAFGYGIGSSPYWEGIYLDESSGGVTVEYNTSAYMTGAGIYAHKGNSHLIQNNKVYGCKIGLNNKWDGRNTEWSYNTVYSTLGASNKILRYYEDTYTTVVFDNNKYINHYISSGIFNFYINGGSDQNLSFAQWQSTTSKDGNSTINNSSIGTNYTERLIINPTNSSKTYYLNNASNVINEETGISITTDIILDAYESIIVTGLNLDCILEYSDNIAPNIISFVIPATSSSLVVNITSFTADADTTKYLVTESINIPSLTDTNWSTSPQNTYSFSSAGSKTLYAWVRDAAGNISISSSDSVVITVPFPIDISNLISLWEFNEASGTSVADSIGSNTGTATTGATVTTGLLSNARLYNGTNGTTSFTRPSFVNLNMTSNFSVSTWIKPISVSIYKAFMQSGFDNNNYIAFHTDSSNRLCAYVRSANVLYMYRMTTAMNTSTWYNAVMTWDATGKVMNFYVNSILQTTVSSDYIGRDTSAFTIGSTGTNRFSNSIIDQTLITNNILTQQQITDLYNLGNGIAYN